MREPEAAEDVEPRSIFHLCQAEKCEVHNRVTRYQLTPQELAHRKKEALAERVEKLSRVRILEAMRKKLPDALSRPDLEMGRARLLPAFGPRQPPPSLQALRLGREEKQNLMGQRRPWTTRRLRRQPYRA